MGSRASALTYSLTGKVSPMDQRIAYRPEEVAKVCGLGRTTVFELIKSGELESVKVGRARLVPAAAITRWLAGAATETRTAS